MSGQGELPSVPGPRARLHPPIHKLRGMKSLLCFGDSNTYGTAPMAHRNDERRLPWPVRWPGVLQQALGPEWRVIEEGLPGRTIARDDPVEGADRNALRYLQACLQSHRPLDAVVFMLGTNDLKARFGASAEQIAEGLHALIDFTRETSVPEHSQPHIVLVCPAPVIEVGCLADMFSGAATKAPQMAAHYRRIAAQRGVGFVDAGKHIAVSPLDGIHFDESAHAALGAAIATALQQVVFA